MKEQSRTIHHGDSRIKNGILDQLSGLLGFRSVTPRWLKKQPLAQTSVALGFNFLLPKMACCKDQKSNGTATLQVLNEHAAVMMTVLKPGLA